jgi:hypothetical protein
MDHFSAKRMSELRTVGNTRDCYLLLGLHIESRARKKEERTYEQLARLDSVDNDQGCCDGLVWTPLLALGFVLYKRGRKHCSLHLIVITMIIGR